MRVAGFLKVRNEILRGGNLYRALDNLDRVADGGVICDDGSTDGTREHLEQWCTERPEYELLVIREADAKFELELQVKQRMLERLRASGPWDWIWWLDGDEEVQKPEEFRAWIDKLPLDAQTQAYRFHYTQLWKNADWARTDDGFDQGFFIKLWRYTDSLSFHATTGTHRPQFPTEILPDRASMAPFEVLHWGNVGKCLQLKAHQYANGLGGVDRHIAFGHSPSESLASGLGWDKREWSRPNPTYRRVSGTSEPPKPFSLQEIRLIRAMGSLRGLQGWFAVAIPAYNRARDLPRALESLLAQTHEQWIALVLDDGSTDGTPELMAEWETRDPRIFYCRYLHNRGGVAVNEIGMAMACEMAEWWTRLGSDDWFGPTKLAADAKALRDHPAVFGPFTVWKHGRADHVCATIWQGASPTERLLRGEFCASWASAAVRTTVLRQVRARFGSFCDPRLRNMEDFLVNARIARVSGWTHRGGSPDEAFWNCLEDVGADPGASASADSSTTGDDARLTLEIIRSEAGR